MLNPNIKPKRNAMLGKLFSEARDRGISDDDLRDYIAPELIGKRLSAASEKEIGIVIEQITGKGHRAKSKGFKRHAPGAMRYASSMQGLRTEICDLAKERWGDGWSSSLNSLCRKFGVDHYNFLDVTHARAVKQRLLDWNREGAKDAKEGGVPF